MEPAHLVRFHGVVDNRPEYMVALGAFKCPQIGASGRARLNANQHHAALTFGARWPFDGKQRWSGRFESFRHAMRPRRERDRSLCHRWMPRDGAVMADPKSAQGWESI